MPTEGHPAREAYKVGQGESIDAEVRASSAAAECDLSGDRLTGRRILAKAERVQKFVNHDDLRRCLLTFALRNTVQFDACRAAFACAIT